MPSSPTFIDLFSGCGGFSVGLISAGFNSVLKVERDHWAVDTLRQNFTDCEIIHDDIRAVSDKVITQYRDVDLIVGGPPCQGFSVAGTTQFGVYDPRNELVLWYLHWLSLIRPKIAIIENVPNILTKKDSDGLTVPDIVSRFSKPLGYSISTHLLNSAHFGVPQSRRRAFIVLSRYENPFKPPEPTHRKATSEATGDLFGRIPDCVTVGEAFQDLPELEAGEGSEETVPYNCEPETSYQAMMRQLSHGVTNHVAMKHTSRLIERFKNIGAGQSLKDVSEFYSQKEKWTGKDSKKPFKYNNYRLDPSKPSLAIPASFQSLFLHPVKNRNLTAREAARLMSFPDCFEFRGKRTAMSWEKGLSQYNQIGNAVCPLVADALGKQVLDYLAVPKKVRIRQTWKPKQIAKIVVRTAAIKKLFGVTLPISIRDKLVSVANAMLDDDQTLVHNGTSFSVGGFSISLASIPLAILFATQENCPICNETLEPRASHSGKIPFLISKDLIGSLLSNNNDHGLDFHLRSALGIEHQVAHFVGKVLQQISDIEVVMDKNPRTGRNVRTLSVKYVPQPIEDLRTEIMTALRR